MNFSISVETQLFNRHVADFKKKSRLSTGVVLRKFAFDLLAKIIRKMPVLHGRARAGWYAAFEGLGGRGTYEGTPEEEIGRGEGQLIDNTKPRGLVQEMWIEIVNGVSYMIFLEYGWSKQAPYGVVRLSMREMRKARLPKDMIRKYREVWNNFY